MNLNWKQIMGTVEGDDRFYMDTEEDEVTEKEAGWEFLRMFGKDDDVDEESEEESVYSEHSEQEESVSTALSSTLHCLMKKTHRRTLSFLTASRKKGRRKKTLTTTKMMSLISTPTKIWRNRVWIGMTWNVRQLQTIAKRREMAKRSRMQGQRGNHVVSLETNNIAAIGVAELLQGEPLLNSSDSFRPSYLLQSEILEPMEENTNALIHIEIDCDEVSE